MITQRTTAAKGALCLWRTNF